MKILAWSDWRIQSLETLMGIIQKENPDLLLYAGDDLDRLIGASSKIYFKTYNHFIEVDINKLDDLYQNDSFAKNPKIKEIILEFQNNNLNLIEQLDIPFIYVNGNDDYILKINGENYLKISKSFRINKEWYDICENIEGRVDFIPHDEYKELSENIPYIKKVLRDQKEYKILSSSPEIKKYLHNEEVYEVYSIYGQDDIFYAIEKGQNHIDPFLWYTKDNGIYVKISPTYGKTEFNTRNESISIFGSGCSIGRESQIIFPPNEYADIYLSHLPPLGKLDLSSRFGINHIGSKALLEAIHTYHPKFVICGHSHMWGGEAEHVNGTVVVNVSSHDSPRFTTTANYVTITTNDWSYQIKKESMLPENTLSLLKIRGFNTLRKKLREKGDIYIQNEIYHKYHKNLEGLVGVNRERGFYIDVGSLERKEPAEQIKIQKFLKEELSLDISIYRQEYEKASSLYAKLYFARIFDDAFEVLNEVENFGISTLRMKERILALSKRTPKVQKSITFNPYDNYFVDVETGNFQADEPGRLWLIGIASGRQKQIKQFVYPQEFPKFLKYLKDNAIDTLVSWSRYDHQVLRPILKSHKIKMKYYDALQRTANCLSWHTYSLHDLYNALFPDKKTPPELISGERAGLYADHLLIDNSSCPHCSNKKDQIIEEIKKRNKLDVLQMIEICEHLYKEEIYECPNCGFTTKYKKGLIRHIKNKVCKKEEREVKKKSPPLLSINKKDIENLAHFNEYGVFVCNCGKTYLSGSHRYILDHIQYCPQFIFKVKK